MPKREVFKKGQRVGTCFYVKDRPDIKPYTNAEFICGECGNGFISIVNNVKKGISCYNCGLKRTKESMFTHRENNNSKEYVAWINIKNRCKNKKNIAFKNYGGRGIKICERWDNSFELFLKDMGRSPSPDHSVDRFPDKNGDYEPCNCRWATDHEQAINKRNNRYISYKGETKLLRDFAAIYGIPRLTLHARIFREKWSIEKAIETPVKRRINK